MDRRKKPPAGRSRGSQPARPPTNSAHLARQNSPIDGSASSKLMSLDRSSITLTRKVAEAVATVAAPGDAKTSSTSSAQQHKGRQRQRQRPRPQPQQQTPQLQQSLHAQQSTKLPKFEVVLSRSSYRMGQSVVGTLRVTPPPGVTSSSNPDYSLRDALTSITVFAVGCCRIDPRWHNVAQYAKLYGKHPLIQSLLQSYDADLLTAGDSDTVVFWVTNGLEVFDLEERTIGHHKPLQEQQIQQLAYTFRVDIPNDLPHTIVSTTCRYFYSVDVLIKSPTQEKVIKTPFILLSSPSTTQLPSPADGNRRITSGRLKVGNCTGIAHSIGLPLHISPTDQHRPQGQMTISSASTLRPRATDFQTLRVSNHEGRPVCVLTVVGGSQMIPGSRVHLKWDFPQHLHHVQDEWIPCYQVSACLHGEEKAVYENRKTQKTRTFVFDTCHSLVEPGMTDRVGASMLLPLDAPCTLSTDIVECTVSLQVDIVVCEGDAYNNLKLELPCHVYHTLKEEGGQQNSDMIGEEEEVAANLPLNELLLGIEEAREDQYFITHDIQADLKHLSLEMADRIQRP